MRHSQGYSGRRARILLNIKMFGIVLNTIPRSGGIRTRDDQI